MARKKRGLSRKTKRSKKNKNLSTILLIILILGITGYVFLHKGFQDIFSKEQDQFNQVMGRIQDRLASLDVDLSNMSIEEKIKMGTDPDIDTDKDGIPDADETAGTFGFITDPNDPDTDGDGLTDLREYWWITDPTKKDTNGDFISDGESVNNKETYPYVLGRTTSATLGSLDIDGDGLPTAVEIYELGTDYKSFSTDGDRYGDGQEYFGLDTKQEALPPYIKADMFVPAVPDIGIKVHPRIAINLKESVRLGSTNIKKGEHEYKTERESTQTTTFSAGAKLTQTVSAGWPPWKVSAETKVEGYVGIDYSSSSRMSRIVTDTKISSEEIFSSKEVDLAGSTLQIWIDIVNKGNDILISPLKEITLNFYMGNDDLPFYTKTIDNELTNLKPGEKLTVSVDEIPINFRLYQRLMAGETVEVRVPHYSFGEDQIFLEAAKANSIEIDIVNRTDMKSFYVMPEEKDAVLTEVLDLAGISYAFENGAFSEIDGKVIRTGKLPYSWFKILITKKDGKKDAADNINDIHMNKGDRVLIKYYVDDDGDLLSNEDEIILGTEIKNADTDGDGLTDGYDIDEKGIKGEMSHGSSPLMADTDGDGFSDWIEVEGESDPADKSDKPKYPVVFKHSRYRGTARIVKDKIGEFGELEHQISSIYVPEGKAVAYYRGPRLQGEGILLTQSISYLGSDNDKISSIRALDIDDLPQVKIRADDSDKCIVGDIKKNEIRSINTGIFNTYSGSFNPGVVIDKCSGTSDKMLWKLIKQKDSKFNIKNAGSSDKNADICLFEKRYNERVPYLEKCGDDNNAGWSLRLIDKTGSQYNIFRKSDNRNGYLYVRNIKLFGEAIGITQYSKSSGIKWNFVVPANQNQ